MHTWHNMIKCAWTCVTAIFWLIEDKRVPSQHSCLIDLINSLLMRKYLLMLNIIKPYIVMAYSQIASSSQIFYIFVCGNFLIVIVLNLLEVMKFLALGSFRVNLDLKRKFKVVMIFSNFSCRLVNLFFSPWTPWSCSWTTFSF